MSEKVRHLLMNNELVCCENSNAEDLVVVFRQIQRRLAQNREAARKSRLRKKVCLIFIFFFQLNAARILDSWMVLA